MIYAYQRYILSRQKDYVKFSGPVCYYHQNISFAEYMLKQKGKSKKNAERNLAIFKDLTEKE
jgi:hypothetical protein